MDIPEYAGGVIQDRRNSNLLGSEGVQRTATLVVPCTLTAAWLCDLADDIEQQERQKTGTAKVKRGKVGSEKWQKAETALLSQLKKGTLPKSVRKAAKFVGFPLTTTQRAVNNSPLLRSHFGLKEGTRQPQANGNLLKTLASQVDRPTQELLQDLDDDGKKQIEDYAREHGPDKVLELLSTLAKDPDAGRSGDVPLIENADSESEDPDYND